MSDIKELRIKRGSIKGRLTNFKNYLGSIKHIEKLTLQQTRELQNRLSKITELFSEYNVIQNNIEYKENLEKDDVNSDSLFAERIETENNFYSVMAEAQEILEKNEFNYFHPANTEPVNTHSISEPNNPITSVKLPVIKMPVYSGDPTKWLEYRDVFISLIHDNTSLSNVMKFQYLKGSLTGSAASVIESLALCDKNYDIAWTLICDRFNNKRQLVHTHLKSLFDVPTMNKECEQSLRLLIDHISKNLRALSSLGENTENWDSLVIFMYSAKLNSVTCAKWEETKNNLPSPITLEDFFEFLRRRADLVEMINANQSSSSSKQHTYQNFSQANQYNQSHNYKRIDKNQKAFVATSAHSSKACMVCGADHLIYYCKQFLQMSPADRYQHIVKLKACVNCLRSGHFINQCRSGPCTKCGGRHNSLLHSDTSNEPVQSAEERETVSNSKSISLSTCIANQVLLSTANVIVINKETNECIQARCLLDCGSQSSFISQDLKDKLSIKTEALSSVQVTGLNNISFDALQRCNLQVQSCTTNFKVQVNPFVLNQVTSSLPTQEVDISSIKIPKNIQLADPSYHRPARIDLLLGADVFWDVISTDQIRLGKNMPILQNSMFGWLVAGPLMCSNPTTEITCNFSQEIDFQLQKFWELEEVPTKPAPSPEDEACEQHFIENTRRTEDGRFCVKLPLKIEPEKLGSSYNLARKRFDSLERRFQRQPEVKQQYVSFIQDYIDLGHASVIERPEKAVILPHHPVLKEQSESTKCRVVFDASAKTTSGLSLNDVMMVGPTVQDDIFSILIRFREHTYILTGDIEKMYRQIFIDPNQRHLQVILWRENEHEPLKYVQLNTLTYGTSPASFLSTRCLVQLAHECQDSDIKQIILHDFFVDDLNTGHSDVASLQYIYQKVTEQLKSAGFHLRKFKSNSKELLKFISNESKDKEQENLKLSTATNILGIEWDPNTDHILMSVSKLPSSVDADKYTKRKILSISSSIFDPLGLVSVCTIICKMILQSLWAEKIGWDDNIPHTIRERWQRFISSLNILGKLTIPRHSLCANPVVTEVHLFSDSSLGAYSACAYIRSVDALGSTSVKLLCAKTKVSPLKVVTIPRLELLGSLLASRLCDKITKSLRCSINERHFWCDSKIVLGWLRLPPNKLSTFVSHRVAEINELCDNACWKYVPSNCNPADLASRGVYPDEVQSLSLWWEGPPFLMQSIEHWPSQEGGDTQTDLPEIRSHAVTCDVPNTKNSVIEFEKYSSFAKLRRIMAYVCRFINNCKSKNTNDRSYNELNADEFKTAEINLAKLAQHECFSKQINNNNFKDLPALYNLSPMIDETGLVRVGGRIENSEYSLDKKHPIVINAKHHYSVLIFRHFHTKLMHAGPQLLLSVIREQYWPLGGRVVARRTCNKCITCKRMKGAAATQIMGNLPKQRLNPGFPFEVCGTDFAGPFHIVSKVGRGARLIKCYLCVFICFKTKAVHLELVSDLSTEAFILALRRFISRRGKPSEIFCDNGTNFVGASNEIARLVESCSNSMSDLANEGIRFKFSPVYSPHFGGLYERAVKSAKFHMNRVVGNTHLTFEELGTLFAQIEAILNSRPLAPLSSNANDLSPLTSGHFLVGRPLTSLPTPSFEDANPSRLHRYARIEQARQHFWSRWSQEYICELQHRTKWQTRQPNLTPGQLVLIRDERFPPLKWPLGRVIAVHPGSDGATRVADIYTSTGTKRRAINRICPLLED